MPACGPFFGCRSGWGTSVSGSFDTRVCADPTSARRRKEAKTVRRPTPRPMLIPSTLGLSNHHILLFYGRGNKFRTLKVWSARGRGAVVEKRAASMSEGLSVGWIYVGTPRVTGGPVVSQGVWGPAQDCWSGRPSGISFQRPQFRGQGGDRRVLCRRGTNPSLASASGRQLEDVGEKSAAVRPRSGGRRVREGPLKSIGRQGNLRMEKRRHQTSGEGRAGAGPTFIGLSPPGVRRASAFSTSAL